MNRGVGRKVAAKGFEVPALDPSTRGPEYQVIGFLVLLRVVWGWVVAEVGEAAMSGKWVSLKVWGVSVGKSVISMPQSQMRWEPINCYRIVRS